MALVHAGRLPDNIKERITSVSNFNDALDKLMEFTSDLGFTQVLYAYLPVRPQLPSGEWLPLKLNATNRSQAVAKAVHLGLI